jgi:hypothetical protein
MKQPRISELRGMAMRLGFLYEKRPVSAPRGLSGGLSRLLLSRPSTTPASHLQEWLQYFKNPPLILSRMHYFAGGGETRRFDWDGKKIECTESENFFKRKMSIGVSNSNIIARRDSLLKVGGYQLNTFIVDDRALLFRLGLESPMITITYPVTVGHRLHPNNSSKNAGLVTKGTLASIENERKNVYPGGYKLRFDRRGLVGSYLFNTFKRYLGIKNSRQIVSIILKARTMLITGVVRKILSSNYYSKSHHIEINHEAAR